MESFVTDRLTTLRQLIDTCVISVIRAFKTHTATCRSALRTLQDVDAPIAGAVLNAVNLQSHEYSYYHYYYYKREGYAPLTPQQQAALEAEQPPSPPPPN